MREICIILLLVLTGCTGHPFTYRGISQGLTCEQARSAELAQGSVYLREEVPNSTEPEYKLYLFDGTLYGSPVEVRLGCLTERRSQQQLIYDSFYVFRSPQAPPAETFMRRLVEELKPTYGQPTEKPLEWQKADGTSMTIGKSANFGCVFDAPTGYLFGASLRYPIGKQTNYEVWFSVRYGGGVC
jgi:hypothetical protein